MDSLQKRVQLRIDEFWDKGGKKRKSFAIEAMEFVIFADIHDREYLKWVRQQLKLVRLAK